MRTFLLLTVLLGIRATSTELPEEAFDSTYKKLSYQIYLKNIKEPLFNVSISSKASEDEITFIIKSTSTPNKEMIVLSEIKSEKKKFFPSKEFKQEIINIEEDGNQRVRNINAKFKDSKASYIIQKDGNKTKVEVPWSNSTIGIYQLLLLIPEIKNLGPKTSFSFLFGSYENAEKGKNVLMAFAQNEEISFANQRIKTQVFSLKEVKTSKEVLRLWIHQNKVIIAKEENGRYQLTSDQQEK